MIYICDANGVIQKVLTQTVNQNSNKANEVVLLAPFPNAEVTVAFTLPNGMHTTQALTTPNMAEVDIDSLITDANGANYGAWTYLLPNGITAIAGQVQVQFYIYTGDEVITTSPATINVAKGVPIDLPETPNITIYTEILNELARLQALAGKGGVSLIEAVGFPSVSDINDSAIYAITGEGNNTRYYFWNDSYGWQQLNATFLTADSLTVGETTDLPNGLYISNNKLYYIYAWQVYQLANSQDIANLTAQITALNGAVATASNNATEALTKANNAKETAETALNTAGGASTNATEALNKSTQALQNASTAQETATTANTTATEALNKANSLTTALRFMGNLTTIASLPTPSATTLGEVYNITDAFTTTADFILGAGREYPAGTNVAIVQKVTNGATEYKYDALSGLIDLSGYQTKIVGEVVVALSQATSETEFSLTDAQIAVFQNCDIVKVDATALGLTVSNFYKCGNDTTNNLLLFSQSSSSPVHIQSSTIGINTSTKIAYLRNFSVAFGSVGDIRNAIDWVYLNGSGHPINDNRIAPTTTADAGKYLTVDSSGNIVWASLPIYEGETE